MQLSDRRSAFYETEVTRCLGRLGSAALLLAISVATLADGERRAFTVSDGISMTEIVDPGAAWIGFATPSLKLSPDQSHFVVVTRRGNLETGYNEYALLLYSVRDVEQFANSSAQANRPSPQVLARFETASPKDGIAGVRWLADGRTLAFIGRGIDEIGQVYSVDRSTSVIKRLTDHPEDVGTFDLSLERGLVIYAAYARPDWGKRNRHGYAVASEPMDYLATRDPDEAIKEVNYFVLYLRSGFRKEIQMERSIEPHALWLAPNARWAVTLSPVGRALGQRMWREYEDYKKKMASISSGDDATEAFAGTGPFGLPNYRDLQFVLIDIVAGTSAPILDAPVSWADGTTREALWTPDSAYVVLAPTFLPLDVPDPTERERRRRFAAIAEVAIADRKIARVMELRGSSTARGSFLVTSVQRLADGSIAVMQRPRTGSEVRLTVYRKRGANRWAEDRGASLPNGSRLRFGITQGLNTAPDVSAIDLRTGHRKIITDLNPQLRGLKLGRAAIIEWAEENGETCTAGLLYPADFKHGTRYPLVIQTHGFNRDEFLVDGPNGTSTAFAAQALANKEIMVLQMPMDREGLGGSEEGRNNARRFERAINTLDQRGLVDRGRVGLIGFSRTGMHVHHAIAFSAFPYAAATIADAISATPLGYVEHYGRPYPGMLSWEAMIGAPFWSDGIKLWVERSPAFNLHRIRTPLRIEHLGTYVSNYWDTFAILKRHQRPVEMIHIPLASHRLETPHARYTSQQGNVDWFDFWLNGMEDSDPRKASQYVRWRELRNQHEAHLASLRTGGNLDN